MFAIRMLDLQSIFSTIQTIDLASGGDNAIDTVDRKLESLRGAMIKTLRGASDPIHS